MAVGATSAVEAQPPAASPVLAPEETLLVVSGEGQSRRVPDVAVFSAGVVTQGKTGGDALSANATRMDEVVKALKRAGIAERDIQTSTLSLQPQYSNPEQEAQTRARMTREPYVAPAQPKAPGIIGYEARNNVQVRVRKLGGMGRIIDIGPGWRQSGGRPVLHAGQAPRPRSTKPGRRRCERPALAPSITPARRGCAFPASCRSARAR